MHVAFGPALRGKCWAGGTPIQPTKLPFAPHKNVRATKKRISLFLNALRRGKCWVGSTLTQPTKLPLAPHKNVRDTKRRFSLFLNALRRGKCWVGSTPTQPTKLPLAPHKNVRATKKRTMCLSPFLIPHSVENVGLEVHQPNLQNSAFCSCRMFRKKSAHQR